MQSGDKGGFSYYDCNMVLARQTTFTRIGIGFALGSTVVSAYGQATFTRVSHAGSEYVIAGALSADGRYAAGHFDTPFGNSGFRWSVAGGFEDLGRPAGGETYRNAYVRGISGDGSKVVGQGNDGSTPRAYVWQSGVGVTAPSLPYANIVAVSADGSTYAGVGPGSLAGSVRSWRTVNGVSTDLGLVPGSVWTAAYGMSDDGKTITGYAAFPGSPFLPVRPMVWQEGAGISELPMPTGVVSGFGQAVSRDGGRIVGNGSSLTDSEVPFVWTASGGSLALDKSTVPYGRTYADTVTNAGVIFGKNDANGPYSAIVWESATSSALDLKTWLNAKYGLGPSLVGWNLREIVSATPDGSTLLGNGSFNGVDQSFLVRLNPVPEPGTLAALALAALALTRRRRSGR